MVLRLPRRWQNKSALGGGQLRVIAQAIQHEARQQETGRNADPAIQLSHAAHGIDNVFYIKALCKTG
ncbi:hypothetical protein F2P44_08350 [Massilia sp. CCM 8695]|uniref:Uncharacterized protein n=1 Tax=Massilia frigida TaxID=2609281 RepID=A0ABX0N7P9_9BURK|nr:hypothetical protein [Massilia frigida]NHZ79286.1 hypothetical protein [Massilia frigida]